MGFEGILKQAQEGMQHMPKCDKCGGHLAGGSLTFNDIHNVPKTWCMKCVLEAINFYQRQQEARLKG